MFFSDPDGQDPYPVDGTLEEKAVFSLEQARQSFFHNKKNYRECCEGGARHSAVMLAYGPKTADSLAKSTEGHFNAYLKNVLLDIDGNTTDAKYPTDKMINYELRRIRAFLIINVSQFFHQMSEQLSPNMNSWVGGWFTFCLVSYANRYLEMVFDEISLVIPGKKLQARTTGEVYSFMMDMAKKYGEPADREGYTFEYLIEKMKRELTEFLLVDLPYNNLALEKKDELIPAPKPEGEEKKVLH